MARVMAERAIASNEVVLIFAASLEGRPILVRSWPAPNAGLQRAPLTANLPCQAPLAADPWLWPGHPPFGSTPSRGDGDHDESIELHL